MKQIFGLILGAGLGALIGFYARICGIDLGMPAGVITGEGFAAIAAGVVGAVVGTSVAIQFGSDFNIGNPRGTRIVVGGLGGAATGIMYGALTATVGGALTMIVLGFAFQETRSDVFAGALGGFVIGSIAGSIVGSVLGLLVGSVVGVFVSVLSDAPLPAKPDMVIDDKKKPKKPAGRPGKAPVAVRRTLPAVKAKRRR